MSRLTRGPGFGFPIRGCHPLWPAFPDSSGIQHPGHWPGPRSLATTNGVSLMSFPPATEMFQFAGFASHAYGFSMGYPSLGGLPHSEIPGSTIARISPGLIAACHVLHRLSVPRHPPDALIALERLTQRQGSCDAALAAPGGQGRGLEPRRAVRNSWPCPDLSSDQANFLLAELAFRQ